VSKTTEQCSTQLTFLEIVVQSVFANSGDQALERTKVFAHLPNCHHYELFGVQFVNDLKTQDVQLASCYQTRTEKSLNELAVSACNCRGEQTRGARSKKPRGIVGYGSHRVSFS
jgi:hypothetical protein